ncbi:MAG: ComEC/Rec2 family competence protein [Crocinitomicaceae bacterium]
MLLFDPYLIYSVGFQLSFSAVIGIVYLQPKILQLLEFRFLILDKAWSITCVSIAAQIATFPLTAYYFHQFPTYFLVSNLIVIPASFLMLSGGLTMLLTDIVSTTISGFVGFLLQKAIWLLNELISYVHILPNSMIEWIYMDRIQLMFTYGIVFTFIVGLHYGAFRTLKVSGFLILLLLVWTLKRNETQFQKHELIFYEIKGKLAIDHIQGYSAKLHIESLKEDEAELLAYQINPYRLSSGLRPISEGIMTLKRANFEKKDVISLGVIGNKKIIILDSTTFHLDFKNRIAIDYVIVNKGAVKSLEWLKNNFSFDMIIIGNSNSIYYSKKMKKQAAKLNLKIHSLKEDGALRILLE